MQAEACTPDSHASRCGSSDRFFLGRKRAVFLILGVLHDLMHRGSSLADQAPAVVAQASHSLGDGDLSQFMRRRAMHDQRADLIADSHDLKHARPPAKTCALAVAATGA